MGVGFKGRIIGPNCEFLGVVGWRKKENQSFESDGVVNDWYKERDEHVPHGSFSYLGLDPQFLTLFRLLGP